ncbi:hypothetical protein H2201_009121 [Coniosporium apollinis]|uniref:Uncharacterized protein n=1 Tax=Coniosporium apollinis TaxID=61459 RepID=A0ABQ9NGH5_9PEZI|nr:hypothetical protein H2201_009121 [Coniosporium apollinis]
MWHQFALIGDSDVISTDVDCNFNHLSQSYEALGYDPDRLRTPTPDHTVDTVVISDDDPNTDNDTDNEEVEDNDLPVLKPIVIERFQRMVREVVKEAERVLWEELMWTGPEGRFSIPLDKIVDDVTFTKRGVSFVSKSSSGLADGLDWMIDRMQTSSEGRKMRMGGIWNVRRVRRYIRKVIKYLGLLLFGTHTTYGQPGRGTEITPIRHQNGFLQDRNV